MGRNQCMGQSEKTEQPKLPCRHTSYSIHRPQIDTIRLPYRNPFQSSHMKSNPLRAHEIRSARRQRPISESSNRIR